MSQPDITTTPSHKGTGLAFAYVTTLFFAWGFATSLVDPLIAAVRGVFELSFTEALLTQFAWFTAYGVFSLPAAAILSKLGYARSIVSALGVMVVGALIVPLSTLMNFYPGVLIALFVIGGGVTLLQVAANPLAASLGSPGKSHFRLVFSQAFNSLGTVVGPLMGATVMLSGGIFVAGGVTELASFEGLVLLGLGVVLGAVAGGLIGALKRSFRGWLILGAALGLAIGWLIFLQHYIGQVEATGAAAAANAVAAPPAPAAATLDPALRAVTLRNIDSVFFILAVLFAALGGFIWLIRSKLNQPGQESGHVESPLKALSSKWAVAGAAAIFLYVGSEVSIGSLMTNLLHSEGTLGLRIEDAGRLVALYWAGALMGRFAGSALLTRAPAALLLTLCTVAAAILSFVVFQSTGAGAAFAALSIGLFNSIMFPAIFTLTLERSTAPASATSGLLVFGIIGGALLPLLAGKIADMSGGNLNHAFIVPLIGYVLLTIFAVCAMRTKPVTAAGVSASSH
jgi:FHS family L-fucose permease-like MFS transporter